MLLETRGLVKQFGGLKAVGGIDMAIPAGGLTLIMGPNGSGKTTFFNLISGVLPPSAGQILFKGKNVAGLRSHELARLGISRTFQTIRLFPNISALENVLVARHARSRVGLWDAVWRTRGFKEAEEQSYAQARKALEFVGLWEERARPGTKFPYGVQRRLEIARALASEPELLLLDEPAAGVNPAELDDLLDLIRRIHRQGITILLVEHQLRLAMQLAQHVLVFDGGRKIAEGTPGEVQKNPQVIEAYLGTEAD